VGRMGRCAMMNFPAEIDDVHVSAPPVNNIVDPPSLHRLETGPHVFYRAG
jgi:hypothetical protein